jgi:hypothetical protein
MYAIFLTQINLKPPKYPYHLLAELSTIATEMTPNRRRQIHLQVVPHSFMAASITRSTVLAQYLISLPLNLASLKDRTDHTIEEASMRALHFQDDYSQPAPASG